VHDGGILGFDGGGVREFEFSPDRRFARDEVSYMFGVVAGALFEAEFGGLDRDELVNDGIKDGFKCIPEGVRIGMGGKGGFPVNSQKCLIDSAVVSRLPVWDRTELRGMFEGRGGERWAVEVDEEVDSGMVTRGERGEVRKDCNGGLVI